MSSTMKASILKVNENVTIEAFEGVTTKEAPKTFSELAELRENYDDGFYICDLGEVARLYQLWNKIFPRIRPFYAIKAAPYRPLVAVLASIGGAFDSASKEETDLALKCGAAPNDIIYTHPHKRLSHVEHSKRKNIKTLIFDDECELHKLKKAYPDANLLLRILTDGTNSVYPLSDKFGATMETAYELLKKAKHMDMNVTGISFHVGSGCSDADAYKTALRNAKKLFEFANTLGMSFTVLDIGGGFVAGYPTEGSIEKISSKINSDIDELFPIEQYKDLKIIAEPGRYLCATVFTLATTVISIKSPSRYSNVAVEYTLTEGNIGGLGGLHGLSLNFPGELIPFILKQEDKTEQYAKAWGPTCDGEDVASQKVLLPKVEAGDRLFFKNAGAYSFALNTDFNGFRTDLIYNFISVENEEIFWTMCEGEITRLKHE